MSKGGKGQRLMMSKDAEPQHTSEKHRLPGNRESMDFVQQSILDTMEALEYGERDLFAVRIAVEEAIANAILHGKPAPEFDDVIAVTHPVLRHRILLNFSAEAEGVDTAQIVDQLIKATSRTSRA